jgi:uncharacterized RDD family membrane protein YckC
MSALPQTKQERLYYLAINGQQLGPYSHGQIMELGRAGRLVPDDLVWYDGLASWSPILSVPDFQPNSPLRLVVNNTTPAAASAPVAKVAPAKVEPEAKNLDPKKPESENHHAQSEPEPLPSSPAIEDDHPTIDLNTITETKLIEAHPSAEKAAAVPEIEDEGPVLIEAPSRLTSVMRNEEAPIEIEGALPKAAPMATTADFSNRFIANLIDNILLAVILTIVGLLSNRYSAAPLIFIPAAYSIVMHGWTWHATLGKRLMKIRLIRKNGGDVTYLRATARYFILTLLAPICLFMILFTKKAQGLHDLVCDTWVIRNE